MNSHISPTGFQVPDKAPPRIHEFHALWLEKAAGDLPLAADFDVEVLSERFPLLARIGVEGPDKTLVWREVASAQRWPFPTPVPDQPVVDSVPLPSVKRVMGTLEETLASGVPDYFETMSWLHGGRTLSLARLVAPVVADAGRELIALWEAMDLPAPA